MKKGFYSLWVICAVLIMLSCNKTVSYTDMLNAEKATIKRLIEEKGFRILDDFPKDSVFQADEFVKLENGVYLNIIDKGTKERAELYATDVMARFVVRILSEKGSTIDLLGPHSSGTHPVEFKYGHNTGLKEYVFNDFITPGMASALQYVGDSSMVSLIVPFKQSSSTFQSSGTPLYYEKVKFVFIK